VGTAAGHAVGRALLGGVDFSIGTPLPAAGFAVLVAGSGALAHGIR